MDSERPLRKRCGGAWALSGRQDLLQLRLGRGGRGEALQFPRLGERWGLGAQEPWRSLELPGEASAGGHPAQWASRAVSLFLSKIHNSVLVLSRPCDPGQLHLRSSLRKGQEGQKIDFKELSRGPGLRQQVT